MKKIIISMIVLTSFSAFANRVDWTKVAQQAEASTNLKSCYKSVIKGIQDPKNCVSLQNSCRTSGLNDQDIARTWEEAKLEYDEATKWNRIADAAAKETDDHFKLETAGLVQLDSEIQDLIFNH